MKHKNTKYIIGDVHGGYNTLLALIAQLPDDANSDNIIFLGDLVDRGASSREVVAFVKDGGYDCVLGNHEQLMLDGVDEFRIGTLGNWYSCWIQNGGNTTEISYINYQKDFEEHIAWMRELPFYKTYEIEGHKDLLVSHAPSVDYIDSMKFYQSELAKGWGDILEKDRAAYNMEVDSMFEWMTWYRIIPKKGSEKYFGVSGHNVWNKQPTALPNGCLIDENFASIDTGSCFPGEPFGKLTCLEYPSMKVYQQELIDNIPPKKITKN